MAVPSATLVLARLLWLHMSFFVWEGFDFSYDDGEANVGCLGWTVTVNLNAADRPDCPLVGKLVQMLISISY